MPEQVRIGWRPYVPTTYPTDTDASAFITIAGITNTNQQTAINTLVNELKLYGIWNKMKAIYPFVGGSAASHKWNLKDPRDLNVAYRLTFTGGWTHTSTGAQPNGTNANADTFFDNTKFISLSNASIGAYTRTNRAGSNSCIMGGHCDGVSSTVIIPRWSDGNAYFGLNSNTWGILPTTDTLGFYQVSRNNSSTEMIISKNNSIQTSNSTIGNSHNVTIKLGSGSNPYGAWAYDNLELAFSSIGDGLSSTELGNYYLAVQKFQTILNRHTGTPLMPSGQTAGLLETYSGAAAAFSTRKIRGSYTGSAIRVRRSSDNAEQDIAFDANGGLDTTSLLSFVGSGNGFVTTWYDQSGNGVNISQPTAANQPQIVSAGVVRLLNNKPSIYFDGGNYYFNSSTQTVLSSGSGGYSIFGTAKPSGTSGPKCLFYIGSASGNNGVGFNLSNTQPRHYWFANDFDTSQTFSDTNTIYAVSYDGSKRYTAINNITESQTVSGKNTTSPTLMVGRLQNYGQFFIGLQSELIIYNSYKDTSITNIYGSMNSYYSIY